MSSLGIDKLTLSKQYFADILAAADLFSSLVSNIQHISSYIFYFYSIFLFFLLFSISRGPFFAANDKIQIGALLWKVICTSVCYSERQAVRKILAKLYSNFMFNKMPVTLDQSFSKEGNDSSYSHSLLLNSPTIRQYFT